MKNSAEYNRSTKSQLNRSSAAQQHRQDCKQDCARAHPDHHSWFASGVPIIVCRTGGAVGTEELPGLVVAMYNTGKPRDRSHYEQFRGYHAAFYKHVEPTSVTPFSFPVQDRALHALLVIIARHLVGLKTPDQIDPNAKLFGDPIRWLKERCERTDEDHGEVLQQNFSGTGRTWASVRPWKWGQFDKTPENPPFMYPAGTTPPAEWDGDPLGRTNAIGNEHPAIGARR